MMKEPITGIDIPGTLVTLAVGLICFVAGQFWSLGKFIYRRRMLRKALEREIRELRPWLNRNLENLECMIQLSAVEELANHGPVPIPVQVHAEHFPEINLKLSTSARISINAIYSKVYLINKNIERILDLNPEIGNDPKKFHQLRLLLDTTYRNIHHTLLLVDLHLDKINKQDLLVDGKDKDLRLYELRAENDKRLMQLAAEAQKNGARWIRQKYNDGAVSADDIAPTPAPVPGRFYFDATGTKLKCISVIDNQVTWFQLESKVGGLFFDAKFRQPLESVRHIFPIVDQVEIERLERRIRFLDKQRS